MRLNKFFLLTLLFFTILGIQSFSNCNPTPPPDPGLFDIQVATVDTSNQPLPHILIGLFANSDLRGNRAPYSLFSGCLIDTFYTDDNGFKKISYVSDKYNYIGVGVIPDHHSSPSAAVENHSLNITFTVQPVLPLISVNIKKSYYDSVIVQTRDLPTAYYCKDPAANLSTIPVTLNRVKATSDSHFLFTATPNQPATIYVQNYLNGKITSDSIIIISLGKTIKEVQIN